MHIITSTYSLDDPSFLHLFTFFIGNCLIFNDFIITNNFILRFLISFNRQREFIIRIFCYRVLLINILQIIIHIFNIDFNRLFFFVLFIILVNIIVFIIFLIVIVLFTIIVFVIIMIVRWFVWIIWHCHFNGLGCRGKFFRAI